MSYSQSGGRRSLGQADMTFEPDASGRAPHEAGYAGPSSKTSSSAPPAPSGGGKVGASTVPAPSYAPGPSLYAATETDYTPWIVGGAASLLAVGLLGWFATR